MRALVYSESTRQHHVFGHIGAHRWECNWFELTAGAVKRRSADPKYDHDHDRDEIGRVSVHETKEAAIEAAKKVAPNSVYGCAIVQEHILEWFVETDNVAEWEPYGPQFEVDSRGDVGEV